ncbi:helix-turn-helix domain-containing protein [Plantactinospora sp. ZYX-F-223]|uniref:helix-turn-helix domain-containing protein n=1 Tax=Plantactinospora sp. ZYX-F-223 TaxID=3144103 RepID=UPI0031FCBED8
MINRADLTFSRILKASRIRRGLTQAELATRSMISIRSIRNLELGQAKHPRKQTIDLLADALQLDNLARTEFLLAARPHEVAALPDLALTHTTSEMPHAADPLMGRGHTVELAVNLLAAQGSRWVALSGLAGVGKTRVAQAVAQEVNRTAGQPVLWMSADRWTPPIRPETRRRRRTPRTDLPTTLFELLQRGEQATEELTALVSEFSALIVIDNFVEPVISESALTHLLRNCPNISLLTCSRDPSRYRAGNQLTLAPLAVPESPDEAAPGQLARYPAVHLLLTHLQRIRPDAPITDAQIGAIARISMAVDGIPLALKAAASWLPLYKSDELVELALRAPALLTEPVTEGRDDAGSGLVAALSETVAALPTEHARTLRTLACLAEPWSMSTAAREVQGGIPEAAKAVNSLLQRGLIRPTEHDDGEFGRFRVLNLVRHLLGHPMGLNRIAA